MKYVSAILAAIRFPSQTVIRLRSVIGARLQEDFRLISSAAFVLSPAGAAEQLSRGLVNSEKEAGKWPN